MTIQQLEYVVALDTHRHFVTAASYCHVTQPTITLMVKKLEEEIGILIFDRSKSPLVPTPLGEIFIAKSRAILQDVNHLKELVNVEVNSVLGNFKVGIIPTISPYIIPKFIGRFIEKYPDTILDIDEMQSDAIIESLLNGKIDVGILVTPLNETFLREVPLYTEPFVFYGQMNKKVNSQKTLSIKDLDSLEGLWLLNSGHCFRNQVLNICGNHTNHKNITFKSGSIETLKKMIDNYGGFSLMPEMSLTSKDKEKTILFKDPKPVREVSIVVHKSFAKEGLIEALRNEILKVVPNDFKKNDKYMKVAWR